MYMAGWSRTVRMVCTQYSEGTRWTNAMVVGVTFVTCFVAARGHSARVTPRLSLPGLRLPFCYNCAM